MFDLERMRQCSVVNDVVMDARGTSAPIFIVLDMPPAHAATCWQAAQAATAVFGLEWDTAPVRTATAVQPVRPEWWRPVLGVG